MTRREFLSELRMALEGNIPVQDIEDNIRYYDNYFAESSKSEREVCEELGDPRLIARTLIDSFTASKGPMQIFIRNRREMITAGKPGQTVFIRMEAPAKNGMTRYSVMR